MKLDVREWIALGLVAGIIAVKAWLFLGYGGGSRGGEQIRATLNLAEAMGGADTAGYAKALEPRPFDFPADHGPHPAFRTEWWYVTSNLATADGRRFGVQFTLFRSALAPEAETPPVSSPWSSRQIHMGHLAVTDVADGAFYESERFTRVANGLAGGTAEPLRIWMDDWVFAGGDETDPDAPDAGAVFPLLVEANHEDASVSLRLRPAKPMVLQGDRGLSQKGPEPGNASYYYSFTRLEAEGEVVVEGERYPVSGNAWLDREWSTSALGAEQEGWDWFALQLDDGRDLMVYRLRLRDGSTDPMSEGVLVSPRGAVRRLSAREFSLEETDSWTSPLDGTVYPSGWRVTVPDEGLQLRVDPVIRDQELNVSVRYWEGAVDVSGMSGSGSVSGRGYVELTGYGPGTPGGASGGQRFKPTG